MNDHFDTAGRFNSQYGRSMTRTYHGWQRRIEVSVTYKKRWDGAWVVDGDRYSGAYKFAYRK